MRVGWLVTLVLVIGLTVSQTAAGQAEAQQVQGGQMEECPHPREWQPEQEELLQILTDHKLWVEKWEEYYYYKDWPDKKSDKRANLCNADLSWADLMEVDLTGANLTEVNLQGADLTKAILMLANLTNSYLADANLTGANLIEANLNSANLSGANLTEARLNQTQIINTQLGYSKLNSAIYAPMSAPPSSYVAGIEGIHTVSYPPGHEIGLVQLRDLLQKAGLRDLERQATFTIERGKTWHMLNYYEDWDDLKKSHREFDLAYLSRYIINNPKEFSNVILNWREFGEGLFRLLAFDLTTAYGLKPFRALETMFWIAISLVPIYTWAIFRLPRWTHNPGIYRIWSKERIETSTGNVRMSDATDIERLSERNWRAITWAAYFSLLSAFHIGFREFNVGNWIARVQAEKYTLEPTGWIRVISGIQSLLSVYLLAIWALTYFGRPFQ